MAAYELLQEPGRLEESLGALGDADALALDTEFVREKTYYPRLCLVQVAADDRILLVDALALEDLTPLSERLGRAGTVKILHAARQDVEVLLPVTGKPPAPLLDTQVAAGLLGFAPQVGYADLVRQVLEIELAKGHARTNWAARPLRDEQLDYAADDVRYLRPLAQALRDRLQDAGRLRWLEEDCAALTDPALYRNDPESAWKRLKGLDRMLPPERAAVRVLADWRERRAMRRNLPRGWVLSDDALREIARRRPGSRDALARDARLSHAAAARLGDEILEVLAAARVTEEDEAATTTALDRLTPSQLEQSRRLQAALQTTAREFGLSAEVLATRRDLTAILRGARAVPPLSGWRREIVGEALLAAL